VSLDDLARRIGHRFEDPELLRAALVHRSWVAEHLGARSNERLEFLGDAVLGWVVADLAFHVLSDEQEGKLTDLRKSVVNAAALADLARRIDLGPHLALGRGEDQAGGRDKTSILSDAFEAVIGAVYLDAGADAAFAFVRRHLMSAIEAAILVLDAIEPKSRLQEWAARNDRPAPRYDVTVEGPDHDRRFTATVRVGDRILGTGEGSTKKAAEHAAALEALAGLAGQ
jgi:ribonuclease-3